MIKTQIAQTCNSASNLLYTQDVKSDVDSMMVDGQKTDEDVVMNVYDIENMGTDTDTSLAAGMDLNTSEHVID